MNPLKDDLQDLVQSAGWRWFVARVEREWGPQGDRFLPELKSALNITDNNAAASQARQIVSAQATILMLLKTPHEEIARLRNLERDTAESPRPAMDVALAGQSRRGGL